MSNNETSTPSSTAVPAVVSSPEETKREASWKLPNGIEDHIEAGLIRSTIGILAGGLTGALLFRSGKGMPAAGAAAGLGVALGATMERVYCDWNEKQRN